MLKLLSEK